MAFGLHYSDTIAGRVFSQSATPLGLALPLYTATAVAGSMPIWNPPGSNRNVELIEANFEWASGTAGIGVIGVMAGPLQAIATASGCSALAATTPVSGMLRSGAASKCVTSNAGAVTVTAGTAAAPAPGVPGAGWIRGLASINLENSTTTPFATTAISIDFKGSLIITPGVLVYFACGVASVALYCSTVVWKEIPINPQGG